MAVFQHQGARIVHAGSVATVNLLGRENLGENLRRSLICQFNSKHLCGSAGPLKLVSLHLKPNPLGWWKQNQLS